VVEKDKGCSLLKHCSQHGLYLCSTEMKAEAACVNSNSAVDDDEVVTSFIHEDDQVAAY